MKRLLILAVAVVAILTSCQKDEEMNEAAMKDVVFQGVNVSKDGHKSTPVCDNGNANYAKVVLDGITYKPAVSYNNGNANTQAIKLDPGTYSLQEFVLMHDNGTPGDDTDDVIVSATPLDGSEYAHFVVNPLTFDISVDNYETNKVNVEVICYDPAEYDAFGYDWFNVTEITIREQVFFGSICVDPSDYSGSLYENQSNGLQMNMPAIFKIEVVKNGESVATYTNDTWYGEGQALKVQYPDHKNATDNFEFKLSILVDNGGAFNYVEYHTWSVTDDAMIGSGADKVVDFVLGDCVLGDVDLTLAWK